MSISGLAHATETLWFQKKWNEVNKMHTFSSLLTKPELEEVTGLQNPPTSTCRQGRHQTITWQRPERCTRTSTLACSPTIFSSLHFLLSSHNTNTLSSTKFKTTNHSSTSNRKPESQKRNRWPYGQPHYIVLWQKKNWSSRITQSFGAPSLPRSRLPPQRPSPLRPARLLLVEGKGQHQLCSIASCKRKQGTKAPSTSSFYL